MSAYCPNRPVSRINLLYVVVRLLPGCLFHSIVYLLPEYLFHPIAYLLPE